MQPSIESDASKVLRLVDERADAVLIQLTLEELAAGDVHAFATTGSIKIAAVHVAWRGLLLGVSS